MLKFFRKIRQNLLAGRQFRDYALYAFGEIFLVVVGILIALQINNWNEDKKERKLEHEYLQKIGLNIEEDISKYDQIITAQQTYRNGIDSFLQIVRNPLRYKTTDLDPYYSHLWRFERFTPNKSSFNNLISSGKINIIQNEALLNDILAYYRTIDEQTASVDEAISVYSRNQIGPYFMNFDFMNTDVLTTEHRKRKSLLEYHKDPVVENLISARLLMMDIQKGYYTEQINRAQKLLNQINEDLE